MNKAQWKSFYDKLTILEEQKSELNGMQSKLINENKETFVRMLYEQTGAKLTGRH